MNDILRTARLFIMGWLIVSSTATAAANDEQDTRLVDGIAAVVNDGVVLVSELRNELKEVRKRLRGDGVELPPDDVLREQVLESLITRRLQLSEAEQRGITIDDISLNETIRDIAARNAGSLEQFRRQLEREGESYTQFRQDIRDEMMINRLMQQIISSRVVITEQEVDDYVAAQSAGDESQYLLSHIQVAVTDTADEETRTAARRKIDSIYQQLIDGADFGALAVSESDGRNALDGGDLGWRTPGELPSEFAREARGLTAGEISRPFSTARGYHIIKLHDTKGVERHFVKQVHARHILIETDQLNDDEDVRNQLADLRRQIVEEEADFAELAEEYSTDSGSAPEGGDLGWAEPDAYAPRFAEVLKDLPEGKISEPFQSAYGWHIAEVLGWRDHENTVELQRHQARQTLYERKARVEEELWIRQLRDQAYIDIRSDF